MRSRAIASSREPDSIRRGPRKSSLGGIGGLWVRGGRAVAVRVCKLTDWRWWCICKEILLALIMVQFGLVAKIVIDMLIEESVVEKFSKTM